jgi:hypothetical protein
MCSDFIADGISETGFLCIFLEILVIGAVFMKIFMSCIIGCLGYVGHLLSL